MSRQLFSSVFKEKPRRETVLLFEIGSGSVSGALVTRGASGEQKAIPKISWSQREHIPVPEKADPEKLFAEVLKALEKVSAGLSKEGLAALASQGISHTLTHKAFISFASPWYLSETKTIVIENMKPFAITKELLESAISREEARFETERKADAKQAAELEKKIISIRLDGYETSEPYGKRVTRAEIFLYVSVISKELLEKAGAAIGKHFSIKETRFFSFPLAFYSVIESCLAKESRDFLAFDINRELTDISLSKKGVLAETYSFPVGKNVLIRAISSALGQPKEASASLLSLYFAGNTDLKTTAQIGGLLSDTEPAWTAPLGMALSELSHDHYLPSLAFLLAQTDSLPFWTNALKKQDVSAIIPDEKHLEVRVVSRKELEPYCDFGTANDPFIALGSIYINSFS